MTTQDSPTWEHVLSFANRMELKLSMKRHKGNREGWLKNSPGELMERISDELKELAEAINNGEPAETIANECADVANFAMMVADVCLHIEQSYDDPAPFRCSVCHRVQYDASFGGMKCEMPQPSGSICGGVFVSEL